MSWRITQDFDFIYNYLFSNFGCLKNPLTNLELILNSRISSYSRANLFKKPTSGHSSDHIFHAPVAKLWHYAAELRTLSVTYHLCGSALTNTTDNLSEMCPLKLTDYFPCCNIDHTKGILFPNDFHKLS